MHSKVNALPVSPATAVVDGFEITAQGLLDLDGRAMIRFKQSLSMFAPYSRVVLALTLAGLLLFQISRLAHKPGAQADSARVSILPSATSDANAVNRPAEKRIDVAARDGEGRTPLLLATRECDHEKVKQLLELKANVDDADASGTTSLMTAAAAGDLDSMRMLLARGAKLDAMDLEGRAAVHHAVLSRRAEAVELLLESVPQLEPPAPGKLDLLAMACATADAKSVRAVLHHAPANLEWNEGTRHALNAALANHDGDLTKLLLAKHPAAPMLEGRNVPLLAQAIVDDNADACRALLAAGADPNTVLPLPVDKEFLRQLPSNLRDYTKADEGITPLMIAAGTGNPELVRVLLDAGADKNRMTKKFKMLALYFAVRTEKYKAVQMLLGSGPTPEDLRIEISLTTQRASVIKAGSQIFQTQCSTGREGFATKRGNYVITDKSRSHRSSIYKVEMPYFMRLNCLDFGMHEGVVPNHPASHGCIRLPSAAARKLFSEIPVGTVVMIN